MINSFKARDIAPILEIEHALTVQTTLQASPISMQIKAYGRAAISQALDLQLIRLAGMMNVKHNLTDAQIQTIVFDLLEKYPHETMEDFMLVFKRMRQGYYGPDYHLLNEASIMSCMNTHLEEKWALHDRNMQTQKEEQKKQEASDHYVGLEALKLALAFDGKLDPELFPEDDKPLENNLSDLKSAFETPLPDKKDERKGPKEYQQFKDEYLRKQIINNGNQVKSTNQKPD